MKKILFLFLVAGISVSGIFLATNANAAHPASPEGCNADNSVVNISRSTASAELGEIIVFTVDAGNPASAEGCDIVNRTLTLTLPNGTSVEFGPFDYSNPTVVSPVSSLNYVADSADLVNNLWTAHVDWTGTLSDGFDGDSTGAKQISVNNVPVYLEVSKTADPAMETSYTWTIDKSVTPESWSLFEGDSGTSQYTVEVQKIEGASTQSVSGTITIYNPALVDANVITVEDAIEGVGAVTVECPGGLPQIISAGESLICTYSSELPDTDTRTNTATVTTSGGVGGNTGEAIIDFANVVPEVVNDSINVTDTNGVGPWQFSDSGSVNYEKTFDCSGLDYVDGHAMYTKDNTAEILENGETADASVSVHCYALSVDKTAETAYDRKWNWTIEKSADQTSAELSEGEQFLVNYDVSLNAASSDSAWGVSGAISIYNPAPIAATINSVEDVISPDIIADVICSVNFPYTLAAGATLECDYSADLSDTANLLNTANIVQQNYDYDYMMVATMNGTNVYMATADVIFGEPLNMIDECVNVVDSVYGNLGMVCADEAPYTFEYALDLGTESVCGLNEYPNIATFTTVDTQTQDSDNWNVSVDVICDYSCTLTQGYWKTHSSYGPAPYDNTWALLMPNGESSIFFLSGQTWYEVLWTAPKKGNAYYVLAHQYIAAKLNLLNEASAPDSVMDAITDAEALFGMYTPSQVESLKGKSGGETKDKFISLASILGSYNEGLIGPGHCDSDDSMYLLN
jgi:hypothetical protein